MLIEFSVGNFKSIKEVDTLSMHASNLKSKYPHLESNNLLKAREDLRLLKSKAIYGANASGKSNMYLALEAFLKIIEYNVVDDKVLEKNIVPFKLCDKSEHQPTFFQIQFLKDATIYRYGFVADRTKVYSEWLFKKVERETLLFTREGEESEVNNTQFSEGNILKDILKRSDDVLIQDTYLFLSFIAKILKGKISSELIDFLKNNITMVSGLNSDSNSRFAREFIENENNKKILSSLVRAADMGIDDIDYIEFDPDKKTNSKPEKLVIAVKKLFDDENNEIGNIWMWLEFEESKGTQKMFELAPYIINALNRGGLLFIDEFDSRFHSLLTQKIVELFNSKSNTKGQLIFITHDTNLLSSKLLRRDQISFVSRDNYGVSHFYSLAEFKGVRSLSSYENDYIHGKYGAIPSLGDFEEFFAE